MRCPPAETQHESDSDNHRPQTTQPHGNSRSDLYRSSFRERSEGYVSRNAFARTGEACLTPTPSAWVRTPLALRLNISHTERLRWLVHVAVEQFVGEQRIRKPAIPEGASVSVESFSSSGFDSCPSSSFRPLSSPSDSASVTSVGGEWSDNVLRSARADEMHEVAGSPQR